eukprot:scaffold14012_cov88-Isochrysis_galbana.AAC.4
MWSRRRGCRGGRGTARAARGCATPRSRAAARWCTCATGRSSHRQDPPAPPGRSVSVEQRAGDSAAEGALPTAETDSSSKAPRPSRRGCALSMRLHNTPPARQAIASSPGRCARHRGQRWPAECQSMWRKCGTAMATTRRLPPSRHTHEGTRHGAGRCGAALSDGRVRVRSFCFGELPAARAGASSQSARTRRTLPFVVALLMCLPVTTLGSTDR